ncbi:hypothetical protein WME79_36385 [Sorangium sp. So ce726]|uniref:hypothetical protein n=1 Tax=Sorangium sp. So ce726 TaxID=3133319 RepID=UPI003F6320C4
MFVVTKSAVCATRHSIEVPLYSDFEADYDIVSGVEADWQEIELRFAPDDADPSDPPAKPFATMYRESDPAAVAEEIASMIDLLEGVEPRSGAEWVAEHLRDVRAIYSFTPHYTHDEARDDEAMEALRAVMTCIQRETTGLIYADGEGWSNQDGYQITWEFSESRAHEGDWWVAVLGDDGEWQTFCIELSDPDDQRTFREGRAPEEDEEPDSEDDGGPDSEG